MHVIAWPVLILIALLFVLAMLTGVTLFAVADVFLLFVFLMVLAKTAVLERRRRAVFILQCIEHTMRLNAPLPDMMNAASNGESRILSEKLRSLSGYIEGGMGVADAIGLAGCGVSDRAIRLIAAAEKSGRLQPQLHRIIDEERRTARGESLDSILMFVYPVACLILMLVMLGGIGIFIFPRFVRIFEDFDAELPPLTLWFMEDASMYTPFVFLGAASVAGLFVFKTFWELSHGGPMPRLIPGVDKMAWYLPLWRSSVRSQCWADSFALMGDSLEAGQTLHGSVEGAVSAAGNNVWREQLETWLSLLKGGQSADAAAKQAGLPSLAVGMITTGQASGNLDDVMRFLGRHYRSRFSRIATVIRGIFVPFMVTIVALMIGVFVVALMLPLVELIDSAGRMVF